MKRLISLIALITCIYTSSFADEVKNPNFECIRSVANAARELVIRDYGHNPPLGIVPIAALDDLRCHEHHFMANIAIKIRLQDNEELFGLFHIHATRDGKLISASVEKPWTPFTDMSEFKTAWCSFMGWNQKSREEQGCVEIPKNNSAEHERHK